jgi:cystathionine gamma-synthase
VHYPGLKDGRSLSTAAKYMKGCSGLMSFVLKKSTRENAALFYDNITDPIIKGPSLGAENTMLCPYVLLAHYDDTDEELERLGLDRYLIRISVGVEPVDNIIDNIANALKNCT